MLPVNKKDIIKTQTDSVVSDYHNLEATLLQFDIDNAALQADISNYSNSNYSLQL